MSEIIANLLAATWMPATILMLMGQKENKQRAYLVFLISTAFCFVSLMFEIDFTMIVISVASILLGYKARIRDVIILMPVYIVIAFGNNMSYIIVEKYFRISSREANTFPYYTWVIVLTTILNVVLLLLLRFSFGKFSPHWNRENNRIAFIIVGGNVVLCTFLYALTIFAAWRNHYPTEMEVTNFLTLAAYTVLLIIVTIVTLKVFYDKERIEQERKEFQQIEEYTAQIESMYNNLRAFKHDYVNILTTLSGYFLEKDYQGAEKYFEESILPSGRRIVNDNFKINLLSNITNKSLKGLIASKLMYAHEMGIDVYIDIIEQIDEIAMQDIDLCRVLGIYIDNAIEASLETEKKEIKFNMVKEPKHVAVIIMNSFVDSGLTIGRMEKEGVSSKGENRGVGLSNVRKILSGYPKVYKTTYIEDRYFVQKLEIYNETRN